MAIDTTNLLYIYDNAVVSWLQTLDFDDVVGESVIVKFQAMNKPYAKDTQEELNTVFLDDLPIITVNSFDPQPDTYRRQTGKFRKWDVVDIGGGVLEYKEFKHPKPFKLPYQIDIWTRFRGHMNQILQLLLNEFDTNLKYLTPTLGSIMKTKYMKLELTDVADNSDLEFDEEFQSVQFRKTLSLDADIWIFNDDFPDTTKRIETVISEFKDFVTSTTIEQNLEIEEDE